MRNIICNLTEVAQAKIFSLETRASSITGRDGTKGEGRSREEVPSSAGDGAWRAHA